jgi:PAS domain S-box-containing protein
MVISPAVPLFPIAVADFLIIVALYLHLRLHVRPRRTAFAELGRPVMLAGAAWAVANGLELASVSFAFKVFWAKMQYIGRLTLPAAWLIFALRYSGRERYLTRRTFALLSVVPIAMLLLVLTNEMHGLMWTDAVVEAYGPLLVLEQSYGIGYWFALVYSHALVLVGIGLLIHAFVRSPRMRYWQSTLALILILVPWLFSIAEILLKLDVYIDLMPVGLAFTVPAVLWGFERTWRTDVVRAALGTVIASTDDAIVVLDDQNRIVELNPVAQELIGSTAEQVSGRLVWEVWPKWPDSGAFSETEGYPGEMRIARWGRLRTYEVRLFKVVDQREDTAGRVALLQDVTERRQMEQRLRDTSELLTKIFRTTCLMVAYMDTDFNIIRVNRAYAEADERKSEFFVGKNHFALYPDKENEAIFRRVVRTGEPASFQARPFEYPQHPERGVVYRDWDLEPVKDSSGRVEGLVLSLVDVTERVEATLALQKMHDGLERIVGERTHELQVLYDVAAVATGSLDLQVTLERSLERVLDVLPCQAGTIHLLDPTREELRLAAHSGVPASLVDQLDSVPANGGLIGGVLEATGPVVRFDWARDPLAQPVASASDFEMHVATPMRARGQTVGVLSIFGAADQECDAEDLALLTSVGDHVGIAVENAWLQKRAEQAAVLVERERLARELHDSLTQSLFSLTLFAEVGRDMAKSGELDGIEQLIDEMDAITGQLIKDTRLMIYRMRPAVLDEEGLAGALRRRLGAVEERVGIEARVVVNTLIELSPAVEAELYHIGQEALNNALRHAEATSVTVRILSEREDLVLEVVDNGRGFDLDTVRDQGGMGLTNMRDRVEKLGGTLTILSEPGGGTTVQARVSSAAQTEGSGTDRSP